MTLSQTAVSRPQIFICTLLSSESLVDLLTQILEGDRYSLVHATYDNFLEQVEQGKHQIDCLILEENSALPKVVGHLHREAILLPAVLVHSRAATEHASTVAENDNPQDESCYHIAEVRIQADEQDCLLPGIDQAIAQFLQLSKACRLPATAPQQLTDGAIKDNLVSQQQRLSQKLKERLGYLGVYYKRNPQQFFHKLSAEEQFAYLATLKQDYRDIILNYFRQDNNVNQEIDDFVTQMFFADISILKILEIHMELMDAFAKKLKLEGRNEDILLDYRLTLIDIMAHLCEMYRRSIPKAR
ncbi:circadian clock protein KaiA [Acaryochloris sp. IP29b_bin.148]|uniref:circadian clock protein KaiA n=1 Tax=Acaryochloris sp. IP29b_bin.148 TaxID=2969218 RepID=UPI0026029F0E|nr:circadian clock protein KaiA [Acaryochloris sp. IP29b_bin.148]